MSSFREMMNLLESDSGRRQPTKAEQYYLQKGGKYKPEGRVAFSHYDIGRQLEKALSGADGLLNKVFPNGTHTQKGGNYEKTDVLSETPEGPVGSSVKSHAGHDHSAGTRYLSNTITAHSFRPSREGLRVRDEMFGIEGNSDLMEVLRRFDDPDYNLRDAGRQGRDDVQRLLDHLNDPDVKRKLFNRSLRVHPTSGENPIDQMIDFSMIPGYNGRISRNQPANNRDASTVIGRLHAHDVSDAEIEKHINMPGRVWRHDGERNLYFGDNPEDSTLVYRPVKKNQFGEIFQKVPQMHMNRAGLDKHFPLMWDAIVQFRHGLEKGSWEDESVRPSNIVADKGSVRTKTPLYQKLSSKPAAAAEPEPTAKDDVAPDVPPAEQPKGLLGRLNKVVNDNVKMDQDEEGIKLSIRGMKPFRLPGQAGTPQPTPSPSPSPAPESNRPKILSVKRKQSLDDQVRHSFETFMSEEPMPMMGGDPKAEAEKQGLEFAGFGWYRDPKTGKRVAKIIGDQLVRYDQGMTPATTDTGNPTTVGFSSPADKARSMGLQSDGSGGYIDPSTGQIAARTVNNELVFYDAKGGAVSDGSGGAQLTQSSPSWVDPVSGLIIVPPAQPESPEEQAAAPDPIPALAPMGLDAFFNKRKIDMYRQQATQDAVQADMDARQMEVDEVMNLHPGMRELQRQMDGVVERAMASGDEDTEMRGAILMDMMNDEPGAYLKYFMASDDEDRDTIIKEIKTLMINQAREMQAAEKIDEIGEDSPDWATYYDQGELAKEKIEMMRERLDSRHDKNTGREPVQKMEAGEDYPEVVAGDDVTYRLSPMERAPGQSWWASRANTALRQAGSDLRVDESNSRRSQSTFVSVDWDVNDSESGEAFDMEVNRENMTPRERKRAALDALKTWRNDVLPQLQPGIILLANPIEDSDEKYRSRDSRNQRERIYQLAGFGKKDDGKIGAVVIRNEDGENELVPINPTEEQREKRRNVNETYMRLLDQDLNNHDVEVIYQMLFS